MVELWGIALWGLISRGTWCMILGMQPILVLNLLAPLRAEIVRAQGDSSLIRALLEEEAGPDLPAGACTVLVRWHADHASREAALSVGGSRRPNLGGEVPAAKLVDGLEVLMLDVDDPRARAEAKSRLLREPPPVVVGEPQIGPTGVEPGAGGAPTGSPEPEPNREP